MNDLLLLLYLGVLLMSRLALEVLRDREDVLRGRPCGRVVRGVNELKKALDGDGFLLGDVGKIEKRERDTGHVHAAHEGTAEDANGGDVLGLYDRSVQDRAANK